VLLRAMACALRLSRHPRAAEPRRDERLAELLCRTLGVAGVAAHARAIDQMLVLSADHELNVSAFGVRVTASSGADLYACLCAGLAALSGPWHGGMCNRVETLVHDCMRARDVRDVLRERVRLEKVIPGFGHPLYTARDPRAELLMQRARKLGSARPELKRIIAISAYMADTHHVHPTLDVGLVALAFALRLPAGSAAALFALGRTSGWVAHALEQRAQRHLLRPRARYVGVP
jgi:citrate synthase